MFLSKLGRLCNQRGNVLRTLVTVTNATTNGSAPVPPLSLVSPTQNHWIWHKRDQIRLPVNISHSFNLPNGLVWVPSMEEPVPEKVLDLPPATTDEPKEAARLIWIRKKKMKKHKLRKLRKRLRFERAKIRQRRELKKEKDFQAGLIAQCKEAEAFSAEKYVEERIKKYQEILTHSNMLQQSK